MSEFVSDDLHWMHEALRLARRSEGLTRPNPPVGAVVVKNNQIIGRGWHRKAGGPHAEIYALRQAGRNAKGAALYITLEPCSSHGRTPPCVDAIIESGVARVVVGAIDPNPKHAGRGIRLLQQAGIQTTLLHSPEAAELIAPFLHHQQFACPFFTLKLGLSVDGRIADYRHRSRWITGPEARDAVQTLRRASDVIMVGAGTVRHDNPSLWPRPDKQRNPWRLIIAREGPLPLNSQVFTDAYAHRTILAAPRGWQPALAGKLRDQGATVWELPRTRFWQTLGKQLGELGALRVFCEGGGILAAELIRAKLVDELLVFLSPMLVGGPVGAVGAMQWKLPDAPHFSIRDIQPVGKDLLIRFIPSSAENPPCSPD